MVTQFVVQSTGARIGSGATVLHTADATTPGGVAAALDAIEEFFVDLSFYTPDDVTFTFPSEAKVLNAADGSLTRVETLSPRAPITGQASGSFANGVGALIKWQTADIAGNRRLAGRTFVVPYAAVAFGTNGDLVASYQQGLFDAAESLRDALETNATPLVVWSRTYGVAGIVTAPIVPTRPSTLRSRND